MRWLMPTIFWVAKPLINSGGGVAPRFLLMRLELSWQSASSRSHRRAGPPVSSRISASASVNTPPILLVASPTPMIGAVEAVERHGQQVAGAIAGFNIDFFVKQRMLVGVGYVDGFPGHRHRAGNTKAGVEAHDLAFLQRSLTTARSCPGRKRKMLTRSACNSSLASRVIKALSEARSVIALIRRQMLSTARSLSTWCWSPPTAGWVARSESFGFIIFP